MGKTKKKNNRNRRIALALLMLLISGIALTTATYAWFSANTIIRATGIDVKVTASAGISIAADALTFDKTVDMDQVIAFAKKTDDTFDSTMQLPEYLSPVSTAGITGGNTAFKFFKGTLGEKNVVLLEDSNETYSFAKADANYTAGDFIAFDVYIRSSIDQSLKLNANTAIKLIDGGSITADAQSALRVGFLPLGTSTDTSAAGSQSSAIALNSVASDWKIWNPYPVLHHGASLEGHIAGGTEATEGYYGAIANTTSEVGFNSKGEAASADGSDKGYVKFLYKDVDSSNVPAYYSLVSPALDTYVQGTDGNILPDGAIFNVGAGITKVRIYIWLEGNDVDCVDAISISDGLTIDLGFEVIPDGE